MKQSTDELALNFGFYAKVNSSSRSNDSISHEFAKELEDQLISGAIGLRLNESWGSSPASIDSCLRLADFYGVSIILDTDSMNESYDSTDLQSIIKNRVAAIPLNKNRFESSFTLNEILTHSNLITISSLENSIKTEEYLHDLGVVSVVTSSSFSSSNDQTASSNLIRKTWQLACRVKNKNKENNVLSSNDNQRIKRYIAKYTIQLF
jgi:urease alpha subunit